MSTAVPPAPAAPVADEATDADCAGDDGAQQEVIEGTIGEVLTLPSLCMECFKNVSWVWGRAVEERRRTGCERRARGAEGSASGQPSAQPFLLTSIIDTHITSLLGPPPTGRDPHADDQDPALPGGHGLLL